jgi:WhiB family transcriptional regulator, redox-sensing transcriptional regulator
MHADRFTARLWSTGGEPWEARAACRDEDPELFFPLTADDTEVAKAVCRRCPVTAQCGEVGMGHEFGVWGGLDEADRRRLRKQLAAVTR